MVYSLRIINSINKKKEPTMFELFGKKPYLLVGQSNKSYTEAPPAPKLERKNIQSTEFSGQTDYLGKIDERVKHIKHAIKELEDDKLIAMKLQTMLQMGNIKNHVEKYIV